MSLIGLSKEKEGKEGIDEGRKEQMKGGRKR
jgi:hypothetical protein